MKNIKTENRLSIIWFVGIFLYSVVFFSILLARSTDIFYADDNAMQWGPIVRSAFDSIFAGKGIPYVDLFQYKGLEIFSSGYYGLTNIFMYISYMISRFILSYSVDTLVVYEWLLYWLGLWCMYLILHSLKIRTSLTLTALFAYSTLIIFFIYGFYYFIFNCYLMVPLLVYVLMKIKSTRFEWFVPGILLAFSLTLGHVQYACFIVMMFCIIFVVFSVQDCKISYILKMFTNIFVFALLSSLLLILSINISGIRGIIVNDPEGFFAYSIPQSGFFSLFPTYILEKNTIDKEYFQDSLGLGIFAYLPLLALFPLFRKVYDKYIDRLKKSKPSDALVSNYLVVLLAIMLIILCLVARILPIGLSMKIPKHILLVLAPVAAFAFLIINRIMCKSFTPPQAVLKFIIYLTLSSFVIVTFSFITYALSVILYSYNSIMKKGLYNTDKETKIMHSLLYAAIFFVIFSFGRIDLLVFILNRIPIFNSFRHLYKCAFIFCPLLIIAGAYYLNKYEKACKYLCVVSTFLSVVTLANIIYICYSGIHIYMGNSYYSYTNRHQIQSEVNERFVDLSIDKNYRFLALGDKERLFGGIEYSSSICMYAFTKNIATTYGVFSIGGYDNVYSLKGFATTDHILSIHGIEGMQNNMLTLNKEKSVVLRIDPEYLAVFQKQLVESGVKYILFPSDVPYNNQIADILKECGNIRTVRREKWLYGFDMIELEGIKSICSYDNGQPIPVEASIDRLQFNTNFKETTSIDISITYDPKYILLLKDKTTGNTINCTLKENSIGYISAEMPVGSYEATLLYKNPVMDSAVVLSVITVLLTVGSIVLVSAKCRKDESKEP